MFISWADVMGSMQQSLYYFPLLLVWCERTPMNVAIRIVLRYIVMCSLFDILTTKTSKNGITESFSVSVVNLILLWKLLKVVDTRFVESTFGKQSMLSAFLFYILILFSRFGVTVFWSTTMNTFASVAPIREPTGKPSICT